MCYYYFSTLKKSLISKQLLISFLSLFITISGWGQTITTITTNPVVPVTGAPLMITINGTFPSGVTIQVEMTTDTALTNFVTVLFAIPTSTSSLSGTISAANNSVGGTRLVRLNVIGPSGISTFSNSLLINITGPTFLSTINSINPTGTPIGVNPGVINISGSNFTSTSVIEFISPLTGLVALTTTFINSTTLSFTLPATAYSSGSLNSIRVVHGPTGATSSFVLFSVTQPLIGSVSPNRIPVGSLAFTLTINSLPGVLFSSTTGVLFDGSLLSGAVVTPTSITVTVPSTLLTIEKVVDIIISDATGTFVDLIQFTISAPFINRVEDNFGNLFATTQAPGVGITLIVKGTNFTPTDLVSVNGYSVATFYSNDSTLFAFPHPSFDTSPTGDLLDLTQRGVLRVSLSSGTFSSNIIAFPIIAPTDTTTPANIGLITLSDKTNTITPNAPISFTLSGVSIGAEVNVITDISPSPPSYDNNSNFVGGIDGIGLFGLTTGSGLVGFGNFNTSAITVPDPFDPGTGTYTFTLPFTLPVLSGNSFNVQAIIINPTTGTYEITYHSTFGR